MSRYVEAHKKPAGAGDARPTALQIINDEGLEDKLKDKVFLITGTSSGLGIETGRAIAATGARVFLVVRSLEKGKEACASFLEPGRVELLQLDTSSLSSVRAAAAAFLKKSPTLNVLICNAGIMMTPEREESVDGFENQLATNYLGHFLLFTLLKDALLKGSTPEFNSRVVNVSSSGHHSSEIQFDDFQLKKEGAYDGSKAYGQSKLSQIYQANYIDRHYGPKGLHALSLMPGGIWTNLQRHFSDETMKNYKANETVNNFMKSPAQEWEGKGGKYLEDCDVAKPEMVPGMSGVAGYAYDEAKEERLWKLTLETLGIKD
ncbi:putative oxidoreductase, partial [Lachnellula suecica]